MTHYVACKGYQWHLPQKHRRLYGWCLKLAEHNLEVARAPHKLGRRHFWHTTGTTEEIPFYRIVPATRWEQKLWLLFARVCKRTPLQVGYLYVGHLRICRVINPFTYKQKKGLASLLIQW